MSEEITIDKIEWSALEYNHKEHSPDWYWAVGLIVLAVFVIAIWTGSYLFGIFVVISGASLFLLNLRHPHEVKFSITNEGLTIDKDTYEWEKIKSFNIKKPLPSKEGGTTSKLLVETTKYFLPIYTIPIPNELVSEVKELLLEIIPMSDELNESQSLQFMEKLGF